MSDSVAPKHPGKGLMLTDEHHKVIVAAIGAGMYYRHAAALAGIHETTLIKWRNRGSEDPPVRKKGERKKTFDRRVKDYERCVELVKAIEKAQGQFILQNLNQIQKASTRSWQASAWLLERRHKDQFAIRHEQTGAGGKALSVEVVQPTINDLLADTGKAVKVAEGAIDAELERLIADAE